MHDAVEFLKTCIQFQLAEARSSFWGGPPRSFFRSPCLASTGGKCDFVDGTLSLHGVAGLPGCTPIDRDPRRHFSNGRCRAARRSYSRGMYSRCVVCERALQPRCQGLKPNHQRSVQSFVAGGHIRVFHATNGDGIQVDGLAQQRSKKASLDPQAAPLGYFIAAAHGERGFSFSRLASHCTNLLQAFHFVLRGRLGCVFDRLCPRAHIF